MEIKTVHLGFINENCYLVSSDNAAIVIDPGYYSDEITAFLKDNSSKERLIMLTHCHFDHIGAAKKLSETAGVKIAIGRLDDDGLSNPSYNLSSTFRTHLEPFNADILLEDGNIVTVGDLKIKVILTPGHTKGSVCYLIGNNLFSGDTLFYESFGRTDFPGGSEEEIINSFYKLITKLDKTVKVFPGHDDPTTIEHEAEFNPLLDMSLL